MVVDLPAPFGPSRATTSPGSMVRLTPSTAWMRPNDFFRSVSWMAGVFTFSASGRARARAQFVRQDLGVTYVTTSGLLFIVVSVALLILYTSFGWPVWQGVVVALVVGLVAAGTNYYSFTRRRK